MKKMGIIARIARKTTKSEKDFIQKSSTFVLVISRRLLQCRSYTTITWQHRCSS